LNRNYTAIPTKGFDREIAKLSDVEKALVYVKIEIMETDPFYPSLRTHKMKGKSGLFESSVNMDIRILWEFEGDRIILLADVGHHDVLRKY